MKFLSSEQLSQHKYKTPEGYLICTDAILSRTGKQTYRKNEVFTDSDDDSEIEIDRTADEVFSPETLASFENKPITLEHPDENVTSENHNELSVGFVRDVRQGKVNGQDVMLGTLVITDEKIIEEIENGEHTELSCGYDCDISDDSHPQQKNIRGNHVALCEQGRAGIAKIVDSIKDSSSIMRFVEDFPYKARRLLDNSVNVEKTLSLLINELQSYIDNCEKDEKDEIVFKAKKILKDLKGQYKINNDNIKIKDKGEKSMKDDESYFTKLKHIIEKGADGEIRVANEWNDVIESMIQSKAFSKEIGNSLKIEKWSKPNQLNLRKVIEYAGETRDSMKDDIDIIEKYKGTDDGRTYKIYEVNNKFYYDRFDEKGNPDNLSIGPYKNLEEVRFYLKKHTSGNIKKIGDSINDSEISVGKTYTSKNNDKLTITGIYTGIDDYDGSPIIEISYKYNTHDGKTGVSRCNTKDFHKMLNDSIKDSINDYVPEYAIWVKRDGDWMIYGGTNDKNIDIEPFLNKYEDVKIVENETKALNDITTAVESYNPEGLTEDDIEKSGSGWVNRGKEGTHGTFATKKEAREQQKAMFARGYKGDSLKTYKIKYKDGTSKKVKAKNLSDAIRKTL